MFNDAHFMEEIIRNPFDDLPRRVYADWLEENGRASQAEFIRIQWEISCINREVKSDEDCFNPKCEFCEKRRALQDREKDLLEVVGVPHDFVRIISRHRTESTTLSPYDFWKHDGLYRGAGVGGRRVCSWQWDRGFISSVTFDSNELFFKCWKELFLVQPIMHVRLLDCPVRRQEYLTGWEMSLIPDRANFDFGEVWDSSTFSRGEVEYLFATRIALRCRDKLRLSTIDPKHYMPHHLLSPNLARLNSYIEAT